MSTSDNWYELQDWLREEERKAIDGSAEGSAAAARAEAFRMVLNRMDKLDVESLIARHRQQ